MAKVSESIKWRSANPIVRASVTVGTVVALITATGAPMKWMMFFSGGW